MLRRTKSRLPDVHAFLNRNVTTAADALAANSTLFYRLEGMVASGDWRGVQRELQLVFPAIGRGRSHVENSETLVTAGSVQGLQAAWARPFQGNALVNLCTVLDSLEQRYPEASYYAKILPIIQSSGVGKSRLVDELCKSRVGLSFALRKKGQTGYPPGDVEVTEFFLAAKTKHSAAAGFMASAIEYSKCTVRSVPCSLTNQRVVMALYDGQPHDQESAGFATFLHGLMAHTISGETTTPSGTAHESDEHQPIRLSKYITNTRSGPRKLMCRRLLERATELMHVFNNDTTWKGIFNDCPVRFPFTVRVHIFVNNYIGL